jgi:hypothetical protein
MVLQCIVGYCIAHADWTDQIKFKGDIRLRHETIAVENKDTRNRERIRFRLGMEAAPSEDLKVVFQLATGSDDPISRNQSLGSAFTTKSIGFDLAYVEWNPSGARALTLAGGKIKNPFRLVGGTELIWDSDFNPEGFALAVESGSEKVSGFFSAAGLPVIERSSDKDAVLYGAQGGVNLGIDKRGTALTLGLSYFDYSNTQGFAPFYETDNGRGNVLDAAGNYLNDYNLFEAFAELAFTAGKTPANVFFDFVSNSSPDDENTGWLTGFAAGKCKEPGSWAMRYSYRDLGRDAVPGAFTDSDFRGGGTDGRGHELGLDVQIAGPSKFSATYFVNETGARNNGYDRLQLDLNVKF